MTTLTRLEQWKEHGIISPEQHALLAGLSRGEPLSLLLPDLSFRQPLRAVARVVLAGWMVWAHHLTLAITSGRSVQAICNSLQPNRRRRRSHTPAPRREIAFLRHLSEYRGQRSLLGTAL